MYNSQYYTCEQIDERLLQGYLDDYNSQTGQSLTKAQFLTKLGSLFSKEGTIDNTLTQIGYYECDTAAGTAAKVITVANYSLFAGGSMKVKFVNKNTANNATLNINSQGAKALYYNGVRVSSTNTWDANEVVEIYYDGTSYYANNVKGSSGDGVFDISVYNLTEGQPTKYADLATALGPNGQNVPVQYRKGGMSVKFVLSSDNKYVQYRLVSNQWSANIYDWQDVELTVYRSLMQTNGYYAICPAQMRRVDITNIHFKAGSVLCVTLVEDLNAPLSSTNQSSIQINAWTNAQHTITTNLQTLRYIKEKVFIVLEKDIYGLVFFCGEVEASASLGFTVNVSADNGLYEDYTDRLVSIGYEFEGLYKRVEISDKNIIQTGNKIKVVLLDDLTNSNPCFIGVFEFKLDNTYINHGKFTSIGDSIEFTLGENCSYIRFFNQNGLDGLKVKIFVNSLQQDIDRAEVAEQTLQNNIDKNNILLTTGLTLTCPAQSRRVDYIHNFKTGCVLYIELVEDLNAPLSQYVESNIQVNAFTNEQHSTVIKLRHLNYTNQTIFIVLEQDIYGLVFFCDGVEAAQSLGFTVNVSVDAGKFKSFIDSISKVGYIPGTNLINKDDLKNLIGYTLTTDGNIGKTSNTYYITDYIPINGQNIKFKVYTNDMWGSAVVYDKNLKPIHVIYGNGIETYEYNAERGDTYIRFSCNANEENTRANYGDVLLPYKKWYAHKQIEETADEISEAKGIVFMSLGDSITTEAHYVPRLRQLLKPSKYYNLAVAGATWSDKPNTVYNGNPRLDDSVNNVLGNQVQKILNNPNTYKTAPDIIIISAGTNDSIADNDSKYTVGTHNVINSSEDSDMREAVDAVFHNNWGDIATIPITSQVDVNDTYKPYRETVAGAMRYVVTTLQEIYPNARIYILTPIQAASSIRKWVDIQARQRYITIAANHLALPVIHVGEECEICEDFEYLGAKWYNPTMDHDTKSGKCLYDGLHPGADDGRWRMAQYVFKKLSADYMLPRWPKTCVMTGVLTTNNSTPISNAEIKLTPVYTGFGEIITVETNVSGEYSATLDTGRLYELSVTGYTISNPSETKIRISSDKVWDIIAN